MTFTNASAIFTDASAIKPAIFTNVSPSTSSKYEALGKYDTKQGVSAQNRTKCYPKRKVSLCCGPLHACVDLEKFRSSQKLNRIARTFDAFDGRCDGKENKASRGLPRSDVECRGVSGVQGAAPELIWEPRNTFLV